MVNKHAAFCPNMTDWDRYFEKQPRYCTESYKKYTFALVINTKMVYN